MVCIVCSFAVCWISRCALRSPRALVAHITSLHISLWFFINMDPLVLHFFYCSFLVSSRIPGWITVASLRGSRGSCTPRITHKFAPSRFVLRFCTHRLDRIFADPARGCLVTPRTHARTLSLVPRIWMDIWITPLVFLTALTWIVHTHSLFSLHPLLPRVPGFSRVLRLLVTLVLDRFAHFYWSHLSAVHLSRSPLSRSHHFVHTHTSARRSLHSHTSSFWIVAFCTWVLATLADRLRTVATSFLFHLVHGLPGSLLRVLWIVCTAWLRISRVLITSFFRFAFASSRISLGSPLRFVWICVTVHSGLDRLLSGSHSLHSFCTLFSFGSLSLCTLLTRSFFSFGPLSGSLLRSSFHVLRHTS